MKAFCRDCFWVGGGGVARCPACASPRVVRHEELGRLTVAHMDCDAFYASVEKRDRPELRDVPVIVGGGRRGVVTTCCYIARTFGVRSAMPMFKALKLCPQATVIKPDFSKYKAASKHIFGLVADLTPLVQMLSLDEAWMDLSGTERLHGAPPAVILGRLQARIEAETRLTVSIGLAPNKFLAKVASEIDKPRGYSVIGAADAQAFLAPRPVSILPGVGPVFARSLGAAGFRTVGDLARAEPKVLAKAFGASGLRLSRLAIGQDARDVHPDHVRKTVSAETTFNEDLSDYEALQDRLWPLCEKVARQMRAGGTRGRAVVLKLKTTDFRLLTRRRTLEDPTQTARTLFDVGRDLLKAEITGRRYRLIGIGLGDITDSAGAEAALFETVEERALKSERALDALRSRFGSEAVVSGRMLRRNMAPDGPKRSD